MKGLEPKSKKKKRKKRFRGGARHLFKVKGYPSQQIVSRAESGSGEILRGGA